MISKALLLLALVCAATCDPCVVLQSYATLSGCTGAYTTLTVPMGCTADASGNYWSYGAARRGAGVVKYSWGLDSTCGMPPPGSNKFRFGGWGTTYNPNACVGDIMFIQKADCTPPSPTISYDASNLCVRKDTYSGLNAQGTVTTTNVPCGVCAPDTATKTVCDTKYGTVTVTKYQPFDTTCQGAPLVAPVTYNGGEVKGVVNYRQWLTCPPSATVAPQTPAPTFKNTCFTLTVGECASGTPTTYTTPCGVCTTIGVNNVVATCDSVGNTVALVVFNDGACASPALKKNMKQGICDDAGWTLTNFVECPAVTPAPTPVPDYTGACAHMQSFADDLCVTPTTTALYTCGQTVTGTKRGDITVACGPDTAVQLSLVRSGNVIKTFDRYYQGKCTSGEIFTGFVVCPPPATTTAAPS